MAWDRGPTEVHFERITVVTSRHWDNPQITITVNQDKIEIVCGINDFVNALLAEIGNPAMIFTRKSLRSRAIVAMNNAIEKIKEASAKVM